MAEDKLLKESLLATNLFTSSQRNRFRLLYLLIYQKYCMFLTGFGILNNNKGCPMSRILKKPIKFFSSLFNNKLHVRETISESSRTDLSIRDREIRDPGSKFSRGMRESRGKDLR